MKYQLIEYIFDNRTKRFKEYKKTYLGNYALESMILELIEKYYSPSIRDEVKGILTNKYIKGE